MPGGVSTLAADFPGFTSIQPPSSQSQPANMALQQLNDAMQRAGFEQVGMMGVEPQFSFTRFIRIVGDIGHGLGLFSADATDFDMQLFDGWMQGQVADLISKLYSYVNQYSQLVDCVPLVTETVNLFTQKKYIKALAKGYEAFNCIRSKL